MQPAIPEPPALIRQFPQPRAQGGIVGAFGSIADHAPVRGDNGARPPLAHLEANPEMRDRVPRGGGRHHFFCHEFLQPGIVEHRIGIEPLQPRVLVLERPEPLGIRNIHPAVLRLPGVERCRRHPVLAAKLGDNRPRLMLSQNPDDLLFREPAPSHIRSLSCGPDSSYPWRRNKGARHQSETPRLAEAEDRHSASLTICAIRSLISSPLSAADTTNKPVSDLGSRSSLQARRFL